MLELGLIERNTKRPITEWLEVQDRAAAFDFEKAITLRMLAYDNKQTEDEIIALAKRIAYEVSKLFGDGEEENSGVGM